MTLNSVMQKFGNEIIKPKSNLLGYSLVWGGVNEAEASNHEN
jgi:hypothetical protein